jgi:hypothetical protein
MIYNAIKSTVADLWILDEIIFIRYHESAVIDLDASILLMKEREKFSKGKPYPVLADGTKALYWTNQSRIFMAGREYNKLIIAVALIISSYVQKILADYYCKMQQPGVQTKYFMNQPEAISWLNSYR